MGMDNGKDEYKTMIRVDLDTYQYCMYIHTPRKAQFTGVHMHVGTSGSQLQNIKKNSRMRERHRIQEIPFSLIGVEWSGVASLFRLLFFKKSPFFSSLYNYHI
jgi:hypothetical protein